MAGSLVFSTFFFLKEVCVHRLGMSMWAWLTVSCALSFFLVHFAPDPFEGFFWYNGSLFYTFFHSLMLCALTFALKFLRAPTLGRSLACGLAAGALCFFLGGGNYPTALLTCVLLMGGFLWTLWKGLPLSRKLGTLAFFLLELMAFGISMLAPGNSVRQAHFENRPGAVKSIPAGPGGRRAEHHRVDHPAPAAGPVVFVPPVLQVRPKALLPVSPAGVGPFGGRVPAGGAADPAHLRYGGHRRRPDGRPIL